MYDPNYEIFYTFCKIIVLLNSFCVEQLQLLKLKNCEFKSKVNEYIYIYIYIK